MVQYKISDKYVVTIPDNVEKQNLEAVTKPPDTQLYGGNFMRPEVIGVTTEYASIAEMLGVENEANYGLYQETQMGKYYARILPDGTFENKVVRLISDEQAAKLESAAVASVEKTCKSIQTIIASTPVVDMAQFSKGMEDIQRQVKARVEEMGKNLKSGLERAGFHPIYSSN